MTNYIRKPTVVQAFQYNREAKKDWPQWLQDYQVSTTMGIQPIGAGPGILLIPSPNGPTINVTVGEWVVMENGVLLVYKNDVFEAAFRAENPAAETPAAEAPAAEPVVTPEADAAPAKTGKTGKADKNPAEGAAPAAEDAAS